MDINSILKQVLQSTQASNKQLAGVGELITSANQNEQAVANQSYAGARESIPQQQALAQQQAEVEAQKAAHQQQLQLLANLDPSQIDNAYTQSLSELTALSAQRRQAAQQVTDLSSKGLLDDPFGYVMAQLSLPAAQAQLEGLTAQSQIVTQDVTTRLDLLNKAKSTVTANTVDQVKAIKYDEARLKSEAAARELNMAEAGTRSKLAAQQMQIVNISDKINDNMRGVFSMQMQASQWAETMAERKEARAERAAAAAERAARAKDKATEDAILLANLNRAAVSLGFPPMSIDAFKAMPNTPQKKAIIDIANTGTFGADLTDSFRTLTAAGANLQAISAGGNKGFTELIQGLNLGMQISVNTARKSVDKTGKMLSEKEASVVGAQGYESSIVAASGDPKAPHTLTDSKWDSLFTPYRASYKVLLSSAPAALQGNVVYEAAKNVLVQVPPSSPNFRGEDEQQVLRTVAKMAADKKLPINDAAQQVSKFYQMAAAKNLDHYNYSLLGLPVQTSYMARVNVPGLIFDDKTPAYDLMNEVDAKRMLLSIAAINKPFSSPVVMPGLFGVAAGGATGLGNWLVGEK